MSDLYASFDKQEDAIRFSQRRCKKDNRWLTVQLIGENWIVSEYYSEHWQGWHYDQVAERVGRYFVVTPTEVLTPLEVPVVFEDAATCTMYEGNVHDQRRLAALGHGVHPVPYEHIIGNLVFAPGWQIEDNNEDWQLMDIVNLRQQERMGESK